MLPEKCRVLSEARAEHRFAGPILLALAAVAFLPAAGLGRAYRAWAAAHPHLYRRATDRPLPRHLLPAGLEDAAAAPLVAVVLDEHRARAVWAFAHGMTMLELAGRFPRGADLDAAWRAGVEAFAS